MFMSLKIKTDCKLWFQKILILVIIMFTITSCKQESKINYAIISGTITNNRQIRAIQF